MSNSMSRDISGLPKWAQQRIETLEANVEHFKAKLTEGPENSDTFVGSYEPDAVRPLGVAPRIRFGTDDNDYVEAQWDENTKSLRVRGRNGITVIPEVSNAISIQTRPAF
jgi:hypothetical protein